VYNDEVFEYDYNAAEHCGVILRVVLVYILPSKCVSS
jgi:hypothetical protein